MFTTFRPAARLDALGSVDGVLVVAIAGWVDAGWAGAGAVGAILDLADDVVDVGTFAVDIDARQQRPTIEVRGAGVEEVRWPELSLRAGRLGRDVLVLSGPEPATDWAALRDDVVAIARHCGVRDVCCLGGMPAPVTHRFPVAVRTTGAGPASMLAGELSSTGARLRADYEGPTGLQTVLQQALGAAGIPSVSLWAQIPPYLSALPSAPAVRSLLAAFRALTGCSMDLAPFEEREAAYATQVEAYLATRPDLVDLVARLETLIASAPDDAVASPDPGDISALFAEIDDYLRDRDE